MPSERRFEPVEFSAPTGTRVRMIGVVSFAIVIAFVGFNAAYAQRLPQKKFWPVVIAPLAGLVVIVPLAIFARVSRYRIVDGELQVVRVGRVNRFALAGLEEAEFNPRAMDSARKTIGNDGLGAITGSFRSSALGKFEVLVTDPTRTVVLRWPERTLVVSPDRPNEFVAEVRARAGLRR